MHLPKLFFHFCLLLLIAIPRSPGKKRRKMMDFMTAFISMWCKCIEFLLYYILYTPGTTKSIWNSLNEQKNVSFIIFTNKEKKTFTKLREFTKLETVFKIFKTWRTFLVQTVFQTKIWIPKIKHNTKLVTFQRNAGSYLYWSPFRRKLELYFVESTQFVID